MSSSCGCCSERPQMERSCRTRPQKPQGHFCLLAVRRESLSRHTYKKRGIRFHFLKGGVQGFADRFEEHHTGPVGWWRGGMSTRVGRCVGNPFIKVGSPGRGRRFPGDPECLPSTVTECSLVLKWDMEQVLRELPGAEGAVRPEVSPGGSLLQRWCLKLPGCRRSPRVRMERAEGIPGPSLPGHWSRSPHPWGSDFDGLLTPRHLSDLLVL